MGPARCWSEGRWGTTTTGTLYRTDSSIWCVREPCSGTVQVGATVHPKAPAARSGRAFRPGRRLTLSELLRELVAEAVNPHCGYSVLPPAFGILALDLPQLGQLTQPRADRLWIEPRGGLYLPNIHRVRSELSREARGSRRD